MPQLNESLSAASFALDVNEKLTAFLTRQRGQIISISSDAAGMVDRISDLTRGGKRLRPLFAYWGASATGRDIDPDRVSTLGAALELFQAAALIHDDLIDRSDTRRGGPSVHRRFEAAHREADYALDPEEFGKAAALLAGDLALAWSEELFQATSPTPKARELFDAMRTQVMVGQYLDVLEEQKGPSRDRASALDAALTVVKYKSAKYSVENPVLIGAAMAGAGDELLEQLSSFALPLGIAFQLRDDELGVFGDPDTTGKPAGDDLKEGKRTALMALTMERATPEAARLVSTALGDQDLSPQQVEQIRSIIRGNGAYDVHESLIDEHSQQAFLALAQASVPDDVRDGLRAAGAAAVTRKA